MGGMPIAVPDLFAAETFEREGDPGRAWIEELPSVVDELCDAWGLEIDGDVMHGYLAVVTPVRRADQRYALKVSWIYEGNAHEALALAAWGGSGTVSLIDHDPERGAMLLERLDPHTTLESVPLHDAVRIAARLLRRLCVPCPDGPPSLRARAERWTVELPDEWKRLDHDIPRRTLDAAVDVCTSLGPSAGDLLVNDDLHYGNVLRGTREPWLVIDPKPLRGDPEFAVAPLLWNRFEDSDAEMRRRLDEIVEVAELDAERTRAWMLARTVDDALWSASMGFGTGQAKSTAIARWLTS